MIMCHISRVFLASCRHSDTVRWLWLQWSTYYADTWTDSDISNLFNATQDILLLKICLALFPHSIHVTSLFDLVCLIYSLRCSVFDETTNKTVLLALWNWSQLKANFSCQCIASGQHCKSTTVQYDTWASIPVTVNLNNAQLKLYKHVIVLHWMKHHTSNV